MVEMLSFNLNKKLEEDNHPLDISETSIDNSYGQDKNNTRDKVIRILKHLRYYIDNSAQARDLLKNLNWAIRRIETNTLYSNINDDVDDEEEINSEKTEFLEGIQEFSVLNDIHKQSRDRMICKTAEQSNFNGIKNIREILRTQKPGKFSGESKILSDLKIVEEDEELNFNNSIRKTGSPIKNSVVLQKNSTIKSYNNGKEETFLNSELKIELLSDDIKYETIEDKKVVCYSIENNSYLKEHEMLALKEDFNMNSIVNRNFNIFNFENIFSREKSFLLIGKELFRALDLNNIIDQSKLESFLTELRNNYITTNPYHSERHGADVGQTLSCYLKESEIIDTCFFTDLDILSMVISAIGHDVGHNGKNNNFHINSRSVYAMTYHDKSCLENFHIYLIFNILKKEENNILIVHKPEDFKIIRKRVIESILATDMSVHSKVLTNVKTKLFNWNEMKKTKEDELFINPESKTCFDEQQEIINLVIHSADIAHNTKPFVLSEKWCEYLTEEFHQQGDKEKSLNLPVSFLCDRDTSNVPKSQIGFINFVIIPTFDLLKDAFPSLEYLLVNAKKNLAEWEIMNENTEKTDK